MVIHDCMDACMRLWYCLTRWGVVTGVFCLCMRVHMYAYVCVCAFVRVWVRVCVCVYVSMYFCVYVCMCVCVRAHVDVRMNLWRHILFICTVQSLYYVRVYHRCFLTLACVCVGGLEVGFVSACSWLAPVTGVAGYVLAGVEIGVLSCIFLYFCGC